MYRPGCHVSRHTSLSIALTVWQAALHVHQTIPVLDEARGAGQPPQNRFSIATHPIATDWMVCWSGKVSILNASWKTVYQMNARFPLWVPSCIELAASAHPDAHTARQPDYTLLPFSDISSEVETSFSIHPILDDTNAQCSGSYLTNITTPSRKPM